MAIETWSGGCQCLAVRYRLGQTPGNPCICHCRMCQKQFGNAFGAFAAVPADQFEVMRGQVAWFKGSEDALRGFCRDCGTPLAYKYVTRPEIAVSIGSLDRHAEMRPLVQYGLESREPWFADLLNLPATCTGEGDNGSGDTPERYALIRLTNHQHPDHDTPVWPPYP